MGRQALPAAGQRDTAGHGRGAGRGVATGWQHLGNVTVGLSTVPHIAFLPIVLEPFKQRYPAVKLTIHEGLLSRMQQDPE